jgi:hypothetical protein
VLDRLDPPTRAVLDPSNPAVLNDGSLVVHVRGAMVAMAARCNETLARAIAEECGVRVVTSFAAAAERPREAGSSAGEPEPEPEAEPPVGGELLAARLLSEFDAHEEQD